MVSNVALMRNVLCLYWEANEDRGKLNIFQFGFIKLVVKKFSLFCKFMFRNLALTLREV